MAQIRRKSLTFTDQIRWAIDNTLFSRYEISKRTGIEQSALSRFMRGQRGFTTKTLDKLAALLNLDVVIRRDDWRP